MQLGTSEFQNSIEIRNSEFKILIYIYKTMNLKKILTISVLTFFILALCGFSCQSPTAKKAEEFSLVVWGVYDNSDDIADIISGYESLHPNITVQYQKKVYDDYQRELFSAFAADRGPDIFFMHNMWLPKYADKIIPLTAIVPPVFESLQEEARKGCMRGTINPPAQDFIGAKEYYTTYVDVASDDFVLDGQVYAVPLSCDSLALYYNKELFKKAKITDPPGIPNPPKTWEDFKDAVEKLTVLDKKGNIEKAGAAIGTTKNINRSTDILTLLMLQSGTQMTDSANTSATFNKSAGKYSPGETALQFYTDFANVSKRVYTWNPRMHYSIDSFYEGKAAMMFNYSYHIPTIKAKAAKLNFGVASIPQITGSEVDVNYANYWGFAVIKNKNQKELMKLQSRMLEINSKKMKNTMKPINKLNV